MWKGIDVSDNQGVIAWDKVKDAGCQFAILRSVRRSGKTDFQFDANVAGCRKQNMPISVYKYTYAATEGAAAVEANEVVELLKKYNLKCMVWWDVEDRDTLAGIGKAKLTACIKAAEKVITAAGFKFGIYVGLYVYREKWFDFGQFTCPLWVARYPSTAVKTFGSLPDEKYLPDVGRPIWGWQFSSNGSVPGISTNVDLDICYEDTAIYPENESQYMMVIDNLYQSDMKFIQQMLSEMKLVGSVFKKLN